MEWDRDGDTVGAADGGWSLGDDDRALLRQMITDVRRLLPLARSNDDLIALGEALTAMESVRDGARVEAVIVLSVGFEEGNDTFNEGWFVRLGLSPDSIVLDKLSTTYSVELGLDRLANGYAVLEPCGGFDGARVAAWLAELNQMRQWSTAELRTELLPA